jgi:hypothetical protein
MAARETQRGKVEEKLLWLGYTSTCRIAIRDARLFAVHKPTQKLACYTLSASFDEVNSSIRVTPPRRKEHPS